MFLLFIFYLINNSLAYRSNEGKPWVLPVVKKTELAMANDDTLNHEYLTILGSPMFSEAVTGLLLGPDNPLIKEGLAFGLQTLSGTGALRVGADFLAQVLGRKVAYYSAPSWPNHLLVFKKAGFEDVKTYRYWDAQKLGFNFDGMMEDLNNAPEGAVIVLHACAHNPTGIDPSEDQWKQIADLMEKKKLFPFFDCAYQGFASGDLDKDAKAVRYFASRGFEMFASQSFAKNFGLYSERAGNLVVITKNQATVAPVKSQFTILVRGNYSNPPAHGCRIVHRVLTDAALYEEWKENIKTMSNRILDMRKALRTKLEAIGCPGSWNHITDQIGMFSYTGLTPEQCTFLVNEKHIYLPKSGRVSICGLNTSNVDYVAESIKEAIVKVPSKI